MDRPVTDPTQWRVRTLLSLGTDHIHEMAVTAVASLTTFRLMLGRCLLALDENEGYKEFGCSGAVHYARQRLGISTRTAQDCRRVAWQLEPLPELTLAAEYGRIEWSALRAIVRKATPETEKVWLKLAEKLNCEPIEKLVSSTPFGGLPGDVSPDEKRVSTELRCPFTDQGFRMLEHVRRTISIERGEAVNNADVLEIVLGSYLAQAQVDEETLEKIRQDADKDLQAEEALRQPLVQQARAVAEDVRASEAAIEAALEAKNETDTGKLLAQAVGSRDPQECECECECELEERPRWVVSRRGSSKIPNGVKLEAKPWQNAKLRFNPRARSYTKAQRREILRRDGWCCRTPGCPNKIWLHIHHIKAYSEGGETTEENGVGLCTVCHGHVHSGHLKIEVLPNGELIFLDGKGRRLDRQMNLEIAGWLDKWYGWRGGEHNSHRFREFNGEFEVAI